MNEELYKQLNNLSNNEFENIIKDSPLESYLDICIEKNINKYVTKNNENNYTIIDTKDKEKETYVKYITLVDFLKFLIGKYKNENIELLPGQDVSNNTSKYVKYINDTNNYAYVDSFFYYLSSILLKKHNFIHGIECYDSFICKKKNCKINIADDLEYLCDSNYFNDNIDKLFHFEDNMITNIFSTNKKEKLDINYDNNIDINNIEEITDLNHNTKKEENNIEEIVLCLHDETDLSMNEDLLLKKKKDSAVTCSDSDSNSDSDSDSDSDSHTDSG